MRLSQNPAGSGFLAVLLYIGVGILITQNTVVEAAQEVAIDLPSGETALLDQDAQNSIQTSPMQMRTIVRVRHVRLDVDSILNQPSISIKLFANVTLEIAWETKTTITDGTITRVGHVGTNKVNRAIFSIEGGKVVGTVHSDSRVYQIRPAGGGNTPIHAIYEIDQTKFPSDRSHRRGPISSHPSSGGLVARTLPYRRIDHSPFSVTPVTLPGSTTVDLLVAYGDDVKSKAPNINLEILQAVDDANQTFEDSGIALFLCLVDRTYVPGFVGSGDLQTDLDCVEFESCSTPANSIRSMRDSKSVDLVSVWVEQGNDCGWAYPNDGTTMDSGLAYSVVLRAGPASCATSNYSMAHELGHSMGSRHDRASEGVRSISNGKQNYGHFSLSAKQRTIMATQDFCAGCTRIGYWSNLIDHYSDGSLMGVSESSNAANNAGTLSMNKFTVAGWRTRPTPTCINTPVGSSPSPPAAPTGLRVN